MPRLQVPERYRRAVAKLPELTIEQFDALFSALKSATNTEGTDVAAAILEPIPDVDSLVDAVLSFYAVPSEWEVSAEQFAEDVVESVRSVWRQDGDEGQSLDELERVFRQRLRDLTAIPEVAALVKAARVLTDYDHPFRSVRILSDLRPVFAEEIDQGLIGMGVVHQLKLTYYNADLALEDFYVALTGADIQKLKEAVERAEAKALALRNHLATQGIRYLEGK